MKILLTDLDSTLLTDDKRISDKNLQSINQMINAGNSFVIASGRPLPSVLELAEQYDLIRPGVFASCFNGSLIYDCYNKKMIQQHTVSFEDVDYLFDEAIKEGLHVHTYSDTEIISADDYPEYSYYINHIHMPSVVTKDYKAHLLNEPNKVIIMSFESRNRLIEFQNKHLHHTAKSLNYTYSCDFMLEYSSDKASKGNSLLTLCDYLNIPVCNSVAAGDEENDLSMIIAAGCGVAMINGNDIVKKNADYITVNDNNHDAISEIIDKFIMV